MKPALTQEVAVKTELEQLLDVRVALAETIKDFEERKKKLDADIQAELHAKGVEKLEVGAYKVSITVVDGRSSIDAAQLVAQGVSTEVIKKATKQGAPYSRLDVRKAKEGK